MDLTQLEYFQAVARYENITKAAKALYVSQPTLSQSIRRLEDSLGVELFDRQGGKLRLNEAGRMFLNRVDQAFAELKLGFTELDTYKNSHQDWVFIASSVIDIFKCIMLDYHRLCPDVHIDHSLTFDRGIMELLLNSKVDFAITPTPIDDPNIHCVPLYRDEVFAVVGESHPLACRTETTLEELAGYPLVCNSCDSDINFMESLFQTDYRNLNIIASSSEAHIPRELTVNGFAVGLIPARVAVNHLRSPHTDQHVLRITPAPYRMTCISTKITHQLSPAAKNLYNFILDYCARDNEEVQTYLKEYYGR